MAQQAFSPAQVSPLSTNKPLVVICGATGLLGGAVADALIESRKFRIRGLCKPEDFGASRELQCEGCEMIGPLPCPLSLLFSHETHL